MLKKTFTLLAIGTLLTLFLISNIFAITGAIGNARMILRAQTGDEIEKYILVKNVNDIKLDIELSPSGDLAEDIDLKDTSFTLEAGEEKKAYFTLKVTKSGTTQGNIDIKFTPEEGNGVGLSSTIIVIAEGEDLNEKTGLLDWFTKDDKKEDDATINTENTETGNVINNIVINNEETSINPATILLFIMTTVILIVFIVLLTLKKRIQETNTVKLKPKKGVKKNG